MLEMYNLIPILTGVELQPPKDDRRVWNLSSKKTFSVASLSKHLMKLHAQVVTSPTI